MLPRAARPSRAGGRRWDCTKPVTLSSEDNRNMPRFRIQRVKKARRLSRSSGIPSAWLDALNSEWSKDPKSEVYGAILSDGSEEGDWGALGASLTDELLVFGRYAGVCLQSGGNLQLNSAFEWTRKTKAAGGTSVVSLGWRRNEHPLGPEASSVYPRPEELFWCALGELESMRWLTTLWQGVRSDTFNYGAELIVCVYPEGLPTQLAWDESLSF